MFRVRNFHDDDYQEIMDLWHQTGVTNPLRADNLVSIQNTLEKSGALFILEHSKTKHIIGTSWITNDGRRLYLHHFAIKPEFQGNKLSHVLLKASLEYAKKLEMQMKLEVHELNKIALNLYQKSGFSYLGAYKVYIIRNYDNI